MNQSYVSAWANSDSMSSIGSMAMIATSTLPFRVQSNRTDSYEAELSIVIPCLNECDSVGTVVAKAVKTLKEYAIDGEVIVADNGSTDGSREIARAAGARVVPVENRGYGSALMGGIAAARGEFILMGDADDSYDFCDAFKFLEKLREGCDLVQGCRLPSGGGIVSPGAMPFLHRWVGNPALTLLVRTFFNAPVHDVYCGMRAFRKEWYKKLKMRCTGMEFATEMIVKAGLYPCRVTEVPITLYPDARVTTTKHLRTFRDGWRTLQFFLMNSPRWLYWFPGLLLIALGFIGYCLAMPGVTLFGTTLGAHTLLVASLLAIVGHQAITFGLFARAFAMLEGLLPPNPRLTSFLKSFTLEKGIGFGGAAALAGSSFIGIVFKQWAGVGFGPLDYAHTMRLVIPGVTLVALGVQTIFASFFINLLGARVK
jgi:glycosyltransferase involved in cell wall biosynthesis